MVDGHFVPRFYFDSTEPKLAIGIDTVSGDIFFLRENGETFYSDRYESEEAWEEKVKEIAAKLLAANEESFNDLLKEAQIGNPNRKEALLLLAVKGD